MMVDPQGCFENTIVAGQPGLRGRVLWAVTAAVVVVLFLANSTFRTVRAQDDGGGSLPGGHVPERHEEGRQLFLQHCAACHGESGQGVTDLYDDPLQGDRTEAELTRLIEETMPEGSPEECVGEDAARVAAYIHAAFYSPAARTRDAAARIEFSRLTVRQYEHAVADLVGSFRDRVSSLPESGGLEAEYYRTRRLRRQDRRLERQDATVDFDFEAGAPADGLEAEEFAIRWQGSVLAPATGDYEFVIESENGTRLYVNDMETPLVDAWVRSGDESVHRGSRRLLGGRAYSIRLEFFKFKEPTASIRLKWVPPHGVEEVIPGRCLSPTRVPELLVIETPFPPDDRSTGFERGTSVSPAWQEAVTYAAVEVADYVVRNLRDLGVREGTESHKSFCYRFAETAFRRPLSDEDRQFFVDRVFEETPDLETAVRRVVLLALTSPRFLYREWGQGDFDEYDAASSLAFTLWDSLPDERLLRAAREGRLSTREQLRAEALRMLEDSRARAKLHAFYEQWLHLDRFGELAKDDEEFPGFDSHVAADLRTSLELFLDEASWGQESDFRQLLLADHVYLNGRLAAFFGVDLPEGAPFQPVVLDAGVRAGILSHPYVMAGFSYTEDSSPIHRGVFLARGMLGRFLKPPPEAVVPLPAELHPDLTTRERITMQTNPAACRSCHQMINALGFTLEHFDAVGRYREQEGETPIDASGSYLTRSGDEVTFEGARELALFLASSDECHEAFVEQMFQYFAKQPVQAYGSEFLPEQRHRFEQNDYRIADLLATLAVDSVLHHRRSSETEASGDGT